MGADEHCCCCATETSDTVRMRMLMMMQQQLCVHWWRQTPCLDILPIVIVRARFVAASRDHRWRVVMSKMMMREVRRTLLLRVAAVDRKLLLLLLLLPVEWNGTPGDGHAWFMRNLLSPKHASAEARDGRQQLMLMRSNNNVSVHRRNVWNRRSVDSTIIHRRPCHWLWMTLTGKVRRAKPSSLIVATLIFILGVIVAVFLLVVVVPRWQTSRAKLSRLPLVEQHLRDAVQLHHLRVSRPGVFQNAVSTKRGIDDAFDLDRRCAAVKHDRHRRLRVDGGADFLLERDSIRLLQVLVLIMMLVVR